MFCPQDLEAFLKMHKGRGKSCRRRQIGKGVRWVVLWMPHGKRIWEEWWPEARLKQPRWLPELEDEPAPSAPSCFRSLAGENQSIVLPVFRRPVVKAGRSVVQISCFSTAVFLNSCRVALCTRYLDVGTGLQGSKSQAVPARSASN